MNIKLLHTNDCHIWKKALGVLEDALKENNLPVKYEVITVKNNDEAKKYKFLGSPTILVNDIDVDPTAINLRNYTLASCRAYVFKDKFYEYPPKELIISTLNEL